MLTALEHSDAELVPLPTPASFPFPYQPPYAIQVDFMSALYTAIEARKQVAIFESPTGTVRLFSTFDFDPVLSSWLRV